MTMASAGSRALSPLRALMGLAICCAGPAQADGFCSESLPLAAGVEPALDQLSASAELLVIPGFDRPLIDVGATSILTIEDGRLVPFDDPPLDLWNRLLPVLVRWPDGEVWAYSRVRPQLYRLSPETGAFVPLTLDGLSTLSGFSASGMMRRHADRRQDRYGEGVPPLYGYADDGLVEITQDGVRPLSLPEAWPAMGWVPIVVPELGTFLPAGSGLWFRRDEGTDWQEVARLEDAQSLYSQSPFEMFEVHRSEEGDLWVMLEDRVLVGRMDDEESAPVFGYQLAGDIVVHEPTGQVLVFANEPLAQNGREEPPLVLTEDALYEARPAGPRIMPGYRAAQQLAGSVPFNSWIFHPPSGLTLIAHANGIAGFDGRTLRDLPALAPEPGMQRILRRIGDRHVIDLMGGGLAAITDELRLRPIPLPEEDELVDLDHSALLDRFILRSHEWNRMYTSPDLIRFSAVAGAYEPIVGLAGDLPAQEAVFVNSANSGYLIQACAE